MNRNYSSKTAVRILCALFVLISAAVAVAGPVESVQAQAPAQQQTGGVTDTWAVQISPGTDPDQLALQMGAQNLGQIGALTDYYLFRIPGTDSELTAMADVFAANSQVVSFQQQVARQQSKRVIEDPVYLDQWHLVKANVEPAWNAGFTGTGINIAIVDDGLQHSHPDLSAQYKAALSHDYNGDFVYPIVVEDGDPEDALGHQDYHGTASAGIAAADYNGNALATSCGVGVAYDAGLSGLRLIAAPSTDAQEAASLNFGMNPASLGADFNSIYSNSWGPIDGPDNDGNWQLAGPGPLTLSALQAGVTSGRNGKGSIYVWAAGNGLAFKDNVNYDGYANSRYTIAVGAVDDQDVQAPYSEPGAAMLVTAPGGISGPNGIVTTDLLGHFGYSFNTDCTEGNFDGTSASAPLVSGVVALMLDANPNLGWRDVQNILARTAVMNDPTDTDWDANPNLAGVQNNGAGLHVNHKYGFGLVNAGDAVAMANPATYINLPRAASLSSGVVIPDIDNQNIPDNVFVDGAFDGVFSTYNVTHEMTVEHVEVVFKSSENLNQEPPGTGGYRGDLRIVLTSPSGTVSVLSEPHGDSAPDYVNWKFMTVRNWGESSLGTWTIRVTDEKGGGVSVFDSWQLILHGTGLTADVDVTIGGDLKGMYALLTGDSMRLNYVGVDSGPVKVESITGLSIIASIREAWINSGVVASFAQLMGLPTEQLSDKYVYPGYNNVTLNEQLRIANVDTVDSTVTVTIGGVERGTYTLYPPGSGLGPSAVRVNYAGVDSGPVVVEGTLGVNIISSIRSAWLNNGVVASFVQLMGLPAGQLSDKYVYPGYNNVTLDEQLRIGNVDTVPSTVTVMIGGVLRGTYTLQPSEAVRVNYAGVDSGPVVVQGTPGVNIISSIREAWLNNGVVTSFAQLMGMPAGQLSDKYVYPGYNNVTLNEQLRIANVDTVVSTVTVTIRGLERGTYTLYPPGSPLGVSAVRINYAGVDSGPVVVQGTIGVNIISSIRSAWLNNGVVDSFVQLMGLPAGQMSTAYWFPAYNNVTLNEQLRFGVP